MIIIKISVVIPCYNAENFIGEAIESVLCQTYEPHEVIVIDDGSTDNSVQVIKSFGGSVKLIQQENKGRVEARKIGFKYATGDWIALLDADDYWAKEKLEEQVKAIEKCNNNIVIVHTKDQWIGKTHLYPDKYEPHRPKYLDFAFAFKRNIIATSSVLLRKNILFQVIDYWNLGRLMAEDYGLYLLMLCHGFALYVDKVLSFYRIYDSNVHRPLDFAIGRLEARKNVLNYIKKKRMNYLLFFDWKKIMADNYFHIAWLLYINKQYKDARFFIKEGLSYNILSPKMHLYYLLLLLPENFITFLRKKFGSESLTL